MKGGDPGDPEEDGTLNLRQGASDGEDDEKSDDDERSTGPGCPHLPDGVDVDMGERGQERGDERGVDVVGHPVRAVAMGHGHPRSHVEAEVVAHPAGQCRVVPLVSESDGRNRGESPEGWRTRSLRHGLESSVSNAACAHHLPRLCQGRRQTMGNVGNGPEASRGESTPASHRHLHQARLIGCRPRPREGVLRHFAAVGPPASPTRHRSPRRPYRPLSRRRAIPTAAGAGS
jgi:hypothetical protein